MKRIIFLLFVVAACCGASQAKVYGDVDGDNLVTVADITSLYDYLLSGDASSLVNGDVTGDGVITSSDVTAVYNVLLGILEYTVNGVTFKMVRVEGGTFMMGATEEQGDDAFDDEYPVHQVTLSTFCIGQTEVTQELWGAVMGENPSNANGGIYGTNLQRPVESVSWVNCQEFIERLNELTGLNFRLPTEAEWEFAARGGNHSMGYKYAGSNDIDEVAWYSENVPSYSSDPGEHCQQTVATKMPNELGLYDMSGNVNEWCQDWYDTYSDEAQINPMGPDGPTSSSKICVIRGGSWAYNAKYNRISKRWFGTNWTSRYECGLRLAM